MSHVEIRRATAERWPDVVDLFERVGPRGGTPFTAGCWCQYWHVRGKVYDEGWSGRNRVLLEAQIRSGTAPALLASADGIPVGWCRLGPRESFERLERSPKLARVDDEDVWSLVCLSVHVSERRKGVATALLEGAIDYAMADGVPVLEAYPVRAGHHVIDSFTGYLPMFLAAGFEPVRDAGRRTIVRRSLV
ncbi:MAG: GNAT family N-acetyltransferase [Gaiellaceae bacterium]